MNNMRPGPQIIAEAYDDVSDGTGRPEVASLRNQALIIELLVDIRNLLCDLVKHAYEKE